MSNDSSTGGYLSPTPQSLSDAGLQDFLQSVLVGITGLPGTNVLPAWQQTPPNIPANQDWAAYRVVSRTPDITGMEQHDLVTGTTTFQQHETVEVEVSFYGQNTDRNATFLVAGLQIDQNRAIMEASGYGLLKCGAITAAPTLLKDLWLYRTDVTVFFRRQVSIEYAILDIVSFQGTLSLDGGKSEIVETIVN